MPEADRRHLDALERVEVRSRAAWRAWLDRHHTEPGSIWLVTWRKTGSRPEWHVSYAEQVEEALCFGWIDSLPRALDADRTMLLMSPRRRSSAWSKANKERVHRMIEAGLMRPAGLAAIEVAKANGRWTMLDEVDALVEPDDLVRALAGDRAARERWARFPPSARRGILEWIHQAKRPETRARRIAETVRLAALGLRANTPQARR